MRVRAAANRPLHFRLEEIHAGYGKKEVLRGVSLFASRGEILTLLGPNGSGKSTLLEVAAGFLQPTAGRVLLGGDPINAVAPHQRVKLGIAYFMQGGRTFPNLTVEENIAMGTMAIQPSERKESIDGALELFPNLRNLFGRRAGLLSGGERQALALAMLLVRRPRLLLLDEPSAGLSPKLVQDMASKVQEFSRRWDTTVLLVEQSIHEALLISDRAMVLVNGQIALETRQPENWLTGGQLEQLFLGHHEAARA